MGRGRRSRHRDAGNCTTIDNPCLVADLAYRVTVLVERFGAEALVVEVAGSKHIGLSSSLSGSISCNLLRFAKRWKAHFPSKARTAADTTTVDAGSQTGNGGHAGVKP